jgi:hypothetical protein
MTVCTGHIGDSLEPNGLSMVCRVRPSRSMLKDTACVAGASPPECGRDGAQGTVRRYLTALVGNPIGFGAGSLSRSQDVPDDIIAVGTTWLRDWPD